MMFCVISQFERRELFVDGVIVQAKLATLRTSFSVLLECQMSMWNVKGRVRGGYKQSSGEWSGLVVPTVIKMELLGNE